MRKWAGPTNRFGARSTVRISVRAIGDDIFVRQAIECSAVRLAATRASSDDVDRLRAILDSQRGACDEADYQRFHALDDHLHFAIRQLSGHGVAWSFAYGRASHLERLRRLNLDRPGYIEGAIDEHERVIDAIASNEAVLAAEALRHHLQRAPAQIPELRRRHPNYFELTARIGPAT